jgi:hypothetical protein
MLEGDRMLEQNPGTGKMDQISQALHDLCQPLTTLQCRLEIAQLSGSPEDYRDAVKLGLIECDRMIEGVGTMREIVRTARSAEGAGMYP